MWFIISKKNLIVFSFIIIIFCLVFLLWLDPISLFANSLLTPELFSKENKVLTEEIENQIHTLTKKEEKYAYLTFDDGPSKRVTPKVLDILQKTDTKANFFVVGRCVDALAELVKREYEEGHFIANHGYSHNNNKLYQNREAFLTEVVRTDFAIGKAIGQENYRSHLFRFPNGSMSKNHHQDKLKSISYLQEIDYTYIDWNCLNNDSIHKYSDAQLLSNLRKSAKDKNTLVILMHDSGDVNKTYTALEPSIDYLKKQGYEFRTFYDFFPEHKP